MFISELRMKNFKCFKGEKKLSFTEGINYFVGNNNCGKTTIFRAIEFLQSARNKEVWITKGLETEEVMVEVTLEHENMEEFFKGNNLKSYTKYIFDQKNIKLCRSSENSSCMINGKQATLKNIRIFNPKEDMYEALSTDSIISSLFESQFVYSDINNDEFQDFGKTKIVGKLMSEVAEQFQQSEEWQKLEDAHEVAFGDKGLIDHLTKLQERIEYIMKEQYGDAKIQFDFGLPTIDSFFKTGQILLEENGIKTNASEKGTGMQRALALSLIQLYAEKERGKKEQNKPIFFFIDEPETFLHPMAQDKLLKSFAKLAKNSQIFITTHSPYLLKNYTKDIDNIKIFSRENKEINIKEKIELNLFPHSPTWGEINYLAFNVVSEEFHNELFGLVHNKNKGNGCGDGTVGKSIKSMDAWLKNQNGVILTDSDHINMNNGKKDETMTVYIRNYIDHPGENGNPDLVRKKPNIDEIRSSIEFMLKLL